MSAEETQVEANATDLSTPKPAGPRRPHWAMNFLGVGLLIALCYYGELVLVVILISVLLAFALAPLVDLLQLLRLPRGLATFAAVLLLAAAIGGIFYYSYNQAVEFAQQLPHFASKVRADVMRFRKQAESFEVLAPEHEKGVLNVHPTADWTDILTRGFGSLGTALLACSFVPFLTYFMLT